MYRDSNTPGEWNIAVRYPHANFPVLIGGIGVPPTRWHSGILQVFNEQKSTVSDETRDTQNFDNYVDTNLANIGDSTSIFSKLIGCELSHSSSANLYLICQMDFFSNTVRTKGPNFVDLGIPAVNESDEVNIFGTPATIIRRPMDGFRWYAPDHIFGKASAAGMSATRSEQDNTYKTDFQIWRENRNFGRQYNSTSRPPLDSTPIGTNNNNGTTS